MNAGDHRELREGLGLLATGRADAAESARLRAHLDGCADCRQEYRELRETVGRLALVSPDDLPTLPAPPRELGDRIVGAALAARTSARRRTWLQVAAAAIILLAGGVSGWLLRPAAAPVAASLETVAVVAQDQGIRASAELVPHTWGVEIQLTATGFRSGERYTVEVVSADGRHPDAGAFIGVGDRSMRCNLNSAVLRADATGFRVLDDSGAVVASSRF